MSSERGDKWASSLSPNFSHCPTAWLTRWFSNLRNLASGRNRTWTSRSWGRVLYHCTTRGEVGFGSVGYDLCFNVLSLVCYHCYPYLFNGTIWESPLVISWQAWLFIYWLFIQSWHPNCEVEVRLSHYSVSSFFSSYSHNWYESRVTCCLSCGIWMGGRNTVLLFGFSEIEFRLD